MAFFSQSRTPALVFEHVNNTDFKVGTEPFLYCVYGTLFSWHARCFPVHICVCDGGILKSSAMSLVPESQASSGSFLNHWDISHRWMWVMCYCSMCAVCLLKDPNIRGLMTLLSYSNCTRPWQIMTSGSTCTRSSRWALPGSATTLLMICKI